MAENRVQIFYSPDDETKTIRIKPATEAKQDEIINAIKFPSGTGRNGSINLIDANTAYSVPSTAPASNYVLILYNGSDADIYIGFENSSSGGILLASGGTMTIDLGADNVVYAYCETAGKTLNYSYKII